MERTVEAQTNFVSKEGLLFPGEQDEYTRGFVDALQLLTSESEMMDLQVNPSVTVSSQTASASMTRLASQPTATYCENHLSASANMSTVHPSPSSSPTLTDLSASTVPVHQHSQVVNNASVQGFGALATSSYNVTSAESEKFPYMLRSMYGNFSKTSTNTNGPGNDSCSFGDQTGSAYQPDNQHGQMSSATDYNAPPFLSLNAQDAALELKCDMEEFTSDSDDDSLSGFSTCSTSSSTFSKSINGRPRLVSKNNKQEEKRRRNREAAARCRAKKLETISGLSDRVADLKKENASLVDSVTALREDIANLKQQLVQHATEGCLKLAPDAV